MAYNKSGSGYAQNAPPEDVVSSFNDMDTAARAVDESDLAGDYSEEAAAERKRRHQELINQSVSGGEMDYEEAKRRENQEAYTAMTYLSPGAATYGGKGVGTEPYKYQAGLGRMTNDEAQARSQAGLAGSLAEAQRDRGPMAEENLYLANREAASRGEQLGSLGLNMGAAMGRAPSLAEAQTRMGMNQALSDYFTGTGGLRGAAGLAGGQLSGGQAAGLAAGAAGTTGGFGRADEIAKELSQYGSQAAQVRGQDLTRLGMANQMALFNADLNDKWKLDQMGLAAGYGGLGVQQAGQDMQWFAEAMRPEDIQFQMDQETAGWQAGANIDMANAMLASERERSEAAANLTGGIIQAGLTAVGSLAGPLGSAAGAAAGGAINSATRKFY